MMIPWLKVQLKFFNHLIANNYVRDNSDEQRPENSENILVMSENKLNNA